MAEDLSEYIKNLDERERKLAFDHYRKEGFPYYNLRDYERIQIFRELIKRDLKMSKPQTSMFGDTIKLELSGLGINLANDFHTHIFGTHAINAQSAIANFSNDKNLEYAIKLTQEKVGGGIISDSTLRSMLRLTKNTQICNNFRPLVAKAIYKKYEKGKMIFDPSTGYGARLLGFMSAFPVGDYRYIGIDPDRRTCDRNIEMAKFFRFENKVDIYCNPMEDLTLTYLIDTIDFVFTSPPYFKKEIYSEELTQSCNRYPEYDNWITLFWAVVVKRCFNLLKKDRYFVVNLKNVEISGKKYDIIGDTKAIAEEIGFRYKEEIQMQFPHRFGKGKNVERFEPILVFYKE